MYDCSMHFFMFLSQTRSLDYHHECPTSLPINLPLKFHFDPSAVADSGYNFLSNITIDALLSTTSTANVNDKIKGTIYLVEEGDQCLLKHANEHLHVIQEHALLI